MKRKMNIYHLLDFKAQGDKPLSESICPSCGFLRSRHIISAGSNKSSCPLGGVAMLLQLKKERAIGVPPGTFRHTSLREMRLQRWDPVSNKAFGD